jgi:hypothetical protein
VTHKAGHGEVTLPADYVREPTRLGHAATEHGWQSDTVDSAIGLTTTATTRRGLYVAATRGRDENHICVVIDSDDLAEAIDILETILAGDVVVATASLPPTRRASRSGSAMLTGAAALRLLLDTNVLDVLPTGAVAAAGYPTTPIDFRF